MKKIMSVAVLVALAGMSVAIAANPFTAAVKQGAHWGAVDGAGKIIVPLSYDKIGTTLETEKDKAKVPNVKDGEKNDALGLIEVQADNERGFYNRLGNVIVPVSYDQRSAWIDNIVMVRAHDKYGYYGSDGRTIVSPMYNSATVFCEGLAGVGQNGKYGFINNGGSVTIPLDYDAVGAFQDERAVVNKNHKWGVIDKTGKEIIPCKYDDMKNEYNGGFLGIKQGGYWGFIDKTGTVVIPPQYKSIVSGFHEGYAAVETKDGYAFINSSGQLAGSLLKDIYTDFNEGLAGVRLKNGTKGYINTAGQLVFKADYKTLGPFENGIAEYSQQVTKAVAGGSVGISIGNGDERHGAPVIIPSLDRDLGVEIGVGRHYEDWEPYDRHNGHGGVTVGAGLAVGRGVNIGYINKNGKVVVSASQDYVAPMTNKGTYVMNRGLWGYVRRDGSCLVPTEYKEIYSTDSSGLFLAVDKDYKWGAFSKETGNVVIPFQYPELKDAGAMVAYKEKGLYGIIDSSGSKITNAIYNKVGNAAEGLIPVKEKDSWYYIDYTGKKAVAVPAGVSEVGAFTDGYAPIKSNGKWGLMNKQGYITVTPQFDKLEVI